MLSSSKSIFLSYGRCDITRLVPVDRRGIILADFPNRSYRASAGKKKEKNERTAGREVSQPRRGRTERQRKLVSQSNTSSCFLPRRETKICICHGILWTHTTSVKASDLGGKELQSLGGWLLLFTGGVAPFVEEILFRGYLLTALRRRLGSIDAAAINGVLFGLIHLSSASIFPLSILGNVSIPLTSSPHEKSNS